MVNPARAVRLHMANGRCGALGAPYPAIFSHFPTLQGRQESLKFLTPLLAARENFPLLACENVPLGEAGLLACARRGS